MKHTDISTPRARPGRRLAAMLSVFAVAMLGVAMPAHAEPRVGGVSVAAQAGALTAGTAGSATYEVTVTRGATDSLYLLADLAIEGLPAGATGSFSPSQLRWSGTTSELRTPRTATLTIATTADVPAAATTFTVRVTRTGTSGPITSDFGTGDGTLTVGAGSAAAQTITFDALAGKTFGDADFDVSATASSGLPVSFAAGVTDNCTVTGTLVHLTGAGSCTITASQDGNAGWAAATPVDQTFAIAMGDQTITFDALPDKDFGAADFDVSATASSGLPVSFAATGDCTVVGTLVSLPVAGSCTITASQAGDADYNAAADVEQSFEIFSGANTITFGVLDDQLVSAADFQVVATVSDTVDPATFEAGPPEVCAIADGATDMIHLVGPGTCTVTASFPGAASVAQTFSVYVSSNELWAVTGSTSLAGAPVTVWGYNTSNTPVTQPGGPTLTATIGQPIAIVLHNEVGENTSLVIRGQNMTTDLTGVASGDSKVYGFTPTETGTFIYEAGAFANGQHQVAMGLYGVLVVQDTPATNHVVLVSEIDPALNNAANPAAFDMRNYAPKYELVNGAVYPGTATLASAAPGDSVRLRYANAGSNYHSMGVLGANQLIVADDGHAVPNPYTVVAQTVGPGQTFDAIVDVSAAAVPGTKLAVYDAALQLNNSGRRPASGAAVSYGGALAFIDIVGPSSAGPLVSGLTLTPSATLGDTDIAAVVSDVDTGGQNIVSAEYFIDTVGDVGTGTAMAGTFGSPTADVTATSGSLADGFQHTVYVRGMDSNGWGPITSYLVSGIPADDTFGPIVSGLTVRYSPANGTKNVLLHATADDTTTGGSNIGDAVYTIDGGAEAAMATNFAAPVASLDATISAATIDGLTEGTHVISIVSQDALGNPSAATTIDLVVDKTGPATSNVVAVPNPTNGQLPGTVPVGDGGAVNVGPENVKITADFADSSNIVAAEGFIDADGAEGTGIVFKSNDGMFNSPSESGYIEIPMLTAGLLSDGTHTIYVRGKDAAGNWGTTSTVALIVDKTPPSVSFVATSPNPTAGAAAVTLSATAADAVTAVTAAEWFTGADPGVGKATAMNVAGSGPWTVSAPVDVSTWAPGSYTLSVRVRDAAMNWSTIGTTTATVSPMLYFSTAANAPIPGVTGPFDDADIYSWNGAAGYARVFSAIGAGIPAGADVDALLVVDADTFYVSFDVTVDPPGSGTLNVVADEDVALFDAGVWTKYFDGSDVGLTTTAEDIDAFEILSDGSVVVSILGDGGAVPGIGSFNDEDLIRCVGSFGPATTCTWNFYFDGSDVGLTTGNEDIKGVSISNGNIYLATLGTFTVPGLSGGGEDVFACNGPTTGFATSCTGFSMYFDGSVAGVPAALDGIDLP